MQHHVDQLDKDPSAPLWLQTCQGVAGRQLRGTSLHSHSLRHFSTLHLFVTSKSHALSCHPTGLDVYEPFKSSAAYKPWRCLPSRSRLETTNWSE